LKIDIAGYFSAAKTVEESYLPFCHFFARVVTCLCAPAAPLTASPPSRWLPFFLGLGPRRRQRDIRFFREGSVFYFSFFSVVRGSGGIEVFCLFSNSTRTFRRMRDIIQLPVPKMLGRLFILSSLFVLKRRHDFRCTPSGANSLRSSSFFGIRKALQYVR